MIWMIWRIITVKINPFNIAKSTFPNRKCRTKANLIIDILYFTQLSTCTIISLAKAVNYTQFQQSTGVLPRPSKYNYFLPAIYSNCASLWTCLHCSHPIHYPNCPIIHPAPSATCRSLCFRPSFALPLPVDRRSHHLAPFLEFILGRLGLLCSSVCYRSY